MGDILGLAMDLQPGHLQVLRWSSYGLVSAGSGRKRWHSSSRHQKESDKGHPAMLPRSDVTMTTVGGVELEREREIDFKGLAYMIVEVGRSKIYWCGPAG